jgi:acetate kinase
MADALLVLNAGSSSLKFSLFGDGEPPRLLLRGQLEGIPDEPHFVANDATRVVAEHRWPTGQRIEHRDAIAHLFEWGRGGALGARKVAGVGHRVVHGGTRFTAPVRVNAEVLAELKRLIPLAPLHQPHNVAAIETVGEASPDLPQVACFDTSFHRTQPAVAQAFGLPRRYADEGLHRYGFHGLSYEYIASVLPEIDARAAGGRTVIAHLGNGASLCALERGRSVATTMGFSTLDGLVMGTRCGALDPGVLLYLLDRHGMDARALESLLYKESGLLGVSGVSGDVRTLLASTQPEARAALDLFVYRVSRELGSLTAALGGLDSLVFTGGIGEHATSIRERVCRSAAWLGLELDDAANERGGPCISSGQSRVSAWVVPTNEELMIALHVRRVLEIQ